MNLSFVMSADLSSAKGRETVTFTPSEQVCELVFRAWPNVTTSGTTQDALRIDSAVVGGDKATARFGTPVGGSGTTVNRADHSLYVIPLASCSPANEAIKVELTFSLKIPKGLDERMSRSTSPQMAWLATAYPLLAWQRGVGWGRDAASAVAGEAVTSEVFNLEDMSVDVPRTFEVSGQGKATRVEAAGERAVHHFSAPMVRDAVFVVGDLRTTTFAAAGTKVHLSLPSGSRATPTEWQDETTTLLRKLSSYLGPVPSEDVWITVVPTIASGLEMPAAALMADIKPGQASWLLAHELAHLWFYDMVGNNQALHPWMDESLASFAQQQIQEAPERFPRRYSGKVGQPLSYWTSYRNPSDAYIDGVYLAGAKALRDARSTDPRAFDDSLRKYLRDNAYSIADPADFEAAFTSAPSALEVLRNSGVL